MNELLDKMGNKIGLIRLIVKNFENNLISKEHMAESINKALNELHSIQESIKIKSMAGEIK